MADKNMLSGLIMEGTRIQGQCKLTFVNCMRIDGEYEGEIVSKDQLVVGKTAYIKADIKVSEVVVMGKVEGTISECDLLEIHDGGQVRADIKVKMLDIKPGAVFDGRCEMVSDANKGQK